MGHPADDTSATTGYEAQRFWSKVDVRRPGECWPWRTGFQRGGYGAFWDAGRQSTVSAHVKSWEMEHGRSVPDGMVVRHQCDNPVCVNPSHLEIGTHTDNRRDCIDRGRANLPTGARHKQRARMTAEKVRQMRAEKRDGATHAELADRFGCTVSNVSDIVNRKTWREVADNDG